jgi:hypothetical protein
MRIFGWFLFAIDPPRLFERCVSFKAQTGWRTLARRDDREASHRAKDTEPLEKFCFRASRACSAWKHRSPESTSFERIACWSTQIETFHRSPDAEPPRDAGEDAAKPSETGFAARGLRSSGGIGRIDGWDGRVRPQHQDTCDIARARLPASRFVGGAQHGYRSGQWRTSAAAR